MKNFSITVHIPAKPEAIYKAWLDSQQHSDMTGGKAQCSQEVGGDFSAWDGYISGHNKELIPNQRIVQSWRTAEFLPEDEDSELIVELVPDEEGSLVTLRHQHIPDSQQADYEAGWHEHYFDPMKAYFSS